MNCFIIQNTSCELAQGRDYAVVSCVCILNTVSHNRCIILNTPYICYYHILLHGKVIDKGFARFK